jgi:precorrin-6Y C5,15-methyltransferase (decarboxylating)
MGAEDEAVSWHTPSTLADQTFRSPNMVVITREKGPQAAPEKLHLGMPESAFAHEEGLITKAEIRAVALSRLALMPGLILWDLGAGSGAVAIEASLLMPGGRLWAVEKKPERVAQIKANRRRYGVTNLEVVQAELPAGLEALPDPDRVFIGGSGRALRDTIDRVCRRMRESGIVVVNTVLFDSLNDTLARLKAHGLATDVLQIQIGRSRPLAGSDRLEALNPVWVIRGIKQGES